MFPLYVHDRFVFVQQKNIEKSGRRIQEGGEKTHLMICLMRFLGSLNRTKERMNRTMMNGRGERMTPNHGRY